MNHPNVVEGEQKVIESLNEALVRGLRYLDGGDGDITVSIQGEGVTVTACPLGGEYRSPQVEFLPACGRRLRRVFARVS